MYHAAHFVIELFLFGQIKYDYMRNLPILIYVNCMNSMMRFKTKTLKSCVFNFKNICSFVDIVLNNIHKRANILVSGTNCSSKEKKIIKPLMHSHTYRRGFLWHATVSAHRYPTLYIFLTIRIYSLLNY